MLLLGLVRLVCQHLPETASLLPGIGGAFQAESHITLYLSGVLSLYLYVCLYVLQRDYIDVCT